MAEMVRKFLDLRLQSQLDLYIKGIVLKGYIFCPRFSYHNLMLERFYEYQNKSKY